MPILVTLKLLTQKIHSSFVIDIPKYSGACCTCTTMFVRMKIGSIPRAVSIGKAESSWDCKLSPRVLLKASPHLVANVDCTLILQLTPHGKISCSSGQWVTMINFCVVTFIWCPIVPLNEMRHYWVTKRFPLAGQSASTCPYHPISSSDAPFLFNCEIKVAKYTNF